jgi:hypothetical protein
VTPDEQVAETLRPPKPCSCGATYDAAAWRALRFVGIQDAGDGELLELRDCATCSSTLAIEFPSRQHRDVRPISEQEGTASVVGVDPAGNSLA